MLLRNFPFSDGDKTGQSGLRCEQIVKRIVTLFGLYVETDDKNLALFVK